MNTAEPILNRVCCGERKTMFKKFKKTKPTEQFICSANQNKPECSLIEELREIQEELRLISFNYDEREQIMCDLLGRRNLELYEYYESNIREMPLISFIRFGYSFKDTKIIDYIINKLQKFKECIELERNKEERKYALQEREKEIKEQLGIK